MKTLCALLLAMTSLSAFARDLEVHNCEDYGVTLNSVYSMKLLANGSVKVFEIDMEEPAGAPAGVAVTIDRGEDLSTSEIFCRFIPGFASVNVVGARSSYNQATNTLTLRINTQQLNDEGSRVPRLLTVTINKGAREEAGLVRAQVN